MGAKLLIDTDVLIDVSRGVRVAIAELDRLRTDYELATTVITRMEMIVGCLNREDLEDLKRFLGVFQIVGMGERAAERAAALLERYRLSHGLLIPDALIAGTAIANGLPLMTRNRRDFAFLEELSLFPCGYSIQS